MVKKRTLVVLGFENIAKRGRRCAGDRRARPDRARGRRPLPDPRRADQGHEQAGAGGAAAGHRLPDGAVRRRHARTRPISGPTRCSRRSGTPTTTPTSPSTTTRTGRTSSWQVREAGLGATAHVPGRPDTLEGWEDSAVPVDRLGDYLRDLHRLYEEFGYAIRHRTEPLRPLRPGMRPHPDPVRPLQHRRRRDLPPLHGARRRPRVFVRRFAVGRARRRSVPWRAAAADVRRRGGRPVRRGQGALRPRRTG